MNENELIPHVLMSLQMQAPLLVLIVTGLVVLVADVAIPRNQRWLLALISVIGMVLSFGALHLFGDSSTVGSGTFFGGLQSNYLVFLGQNVILGSGIFLLLISPRYLENRLIPHGEYYALMVFATAAMFALAASSELLTLFLNIELLSITLYVLAGIEKKNMRSTEAAFKYFLLGSFAAAFLLFGIAFVFGATGQTRFDLIAAQITSGMIIEPRFLTIGLSLIIIGFAFKLTLAPFHMYAPDLYEGAPTPVAAAVATGAKVAGFVAFFQIVRLASVWAELPEGIWVALWAICAASMIVGNVGAIVQPNIKRLLAYSSISHSAYTIIPMVVLLMHPEMVEGARDALGYYLLAYAVMTLLVFGVAASLGPAGETRISNYAGLARRHPVLGIVMVIGLLSLLGIPPTIGFIGKLYLFGFAVKGGHIWLAVLGVLTSVMSAYYYLRVIVTMYMEEPAAEAPAPLVLDGVNTLALAVGVVTVFLFAIVPGWYLFSM